MFLGLSIISAGDGNSLNGGRIYQVPIVEQLVYDFTGLVDFEFTQFLDGLKVLSI
jgi:hypothetical protein